MLLLGGCFVWPDMSGNRKIVVFYSFSQTAPRKPGQSSRWQSSKYLFALQETAAWSELSQGEMTLPLNWANGKCFQEETVFLLPVRMAKPARSQLLQQPLGRTSSHPHSASQMLPEASKAQGLPLIFTCAGWPNKTIHQMSVCLFVLTAIKSMCLAPEVCSLDSRPRWIRISPAKSSL